MAILSKVRLTAIATRDRLTPDIRGINLVDSTLLEWRKKKGGYIERKWSHYS
jgi:hypothetical protein